MKARELRSSMIMRILGGLMIALGASAVAIGLGMFLLGPGRLGGATEALFDAMTASHHPASALYGATAESELRFYAPFWLAYGVALIAAARRLAHRLTWVPVLAALFFAGGVGRALAWFEIGPPHPVFTVLMAIELALPPVFLGLWALARKRAG